MTGPGRGRRFLPIAMPLETQELAPRKAALRRMAAVRLPGVARAPEYDPLPIMLPGGFAARLGLALCRRAALLGGAIDDLYSVRSLVTTGAVSAAALSAADGWLRQMVGDAGLIAPRLALYAADLAIDAAGGAVVLRDHVDIVPGLGHAIALRRFTGAAMPELVRSVTLVGRGPLIERWREDLAHWAGGGLFALLEGEAENAADEGADAALLARALGAPRLRPADLDCFGEAPEFRTLTGSRPVRLLIRRMAGAAIDPLEQGGNPAMGIAGVFGALRRHQLAMLNAPGSGIVGEPAIAASIEAAIGAAHEAQFGEPMMLCAGAAAELPLVPLAPEPGSAAMGEAACVLRLFALHCGSIGWVALPGGLGIAQGPDGMTQMKDVWVIDRGEDAEMPSLPLRGAVSLARAATSVLPSRVADDLFWLGRAVERLEAAGRLCALAQSGLAEASALPHEQYQRGLLLRCLVHQKLISPDLAGRNVAARQLREAIAGGAAVAPLIGGACRLLAATSDRFSPTMLATIEGALERVLAARAAGLAMLVPTIFGFAATFAGVIGEDAARDGALLFATLGQRLERLFGLAGSFAILLDEEGGRLAVGASLAIELIDAGMTCEQRYGGIPEPDTALRLLLADPAYPRSLLFQAIALAEGFERLDAATEAAEARAIGVALKAAAGASSPRTALAAIGARAADLSSALTGRLFAPPASSQHRDGAAVA